MSLALKAFLVSSVIALILIGLVILVVYFSIKHQAKRAGK